MVMRYTSEEKAKKIRLIKILSRQYLLLYKVLHKGEELIMLKFLARISEKYAKSTNTACHILWILHQPKMPASLIKKD